MRRRTGAHVLGDKSAVAINQLGAATVVDANDATQVLWVEPSRERSRADEITKHHGEPATLSAVLLGRRDGCRNSRRQRRRLSELPDSLQHLRRWPSGGRLSVMTTAPSSMPESAIPIST
jgi:hypothetical protein